MLTFKRSMLMTGLASSLFFVQGFAEPAAATEDKTAAPIVESQNDPQEENTDLKKLSETFGNFIGKNLNSSGITFDLDSFIEGIRNGSIGKPAPMTDPEFEEAMAKIQENAFKTLAENNLKAAEAFLIDNAKVKNIVEIVPAKLQYEILSEGSGQVVEEHDTPRIQYSGKYIDGTIFGSSEETGGPINLPLDQTIPGFSKGIIGMKEGEKRRLFIHPEFGYGSTGQLPPNSLLIFDVEVLKANTAKEEQEEEKEPILSMTETIEESEEEEGDVDAEDNDQEEGDKEVSDKKALSEATTTAAADLVIASEDVQNEKETLIVSNQMSGLQNANLGAPDVNEINPLLNPESDVKLHLSEEENTESDSKANPYNQTESDLDIDKLKKTDQNTLDQQRNIPRSFKTAPGNKTSSTTNK